MRLGPHYRAQLRTTHTAFGDGPRSSSRCFMPVAEREFYALHSRKRPYLPDELERLAIAIEGGLGLDWWRDYYAISPRHQQELEAEAARKRIEEQRARKWREFEKEREREYQQKMRLSQPRGRHPGACQHGEITWGIASRCGKCWNAFYAANLAPRGTSMSVGLAEAVNLTGWPPK